jgi:hypothetical protein
VSHILFSFRYECAVLSRIPTSLAGLRECLGGISYQDALEQLPKRVVQWIKNTYRHSQRRDVDVG